MDKKKRRMIDIAFVVLAILVVAFFLRAPEETTHRVPFDENHQRFYPMITEQGKKVAEKFCVECHTEGGVPFPEGHPPKNRCLLCHKLEEGH